MLTRLLAACALTLPPASLLLAEDLEKKTSADEVVSKAVRVKGDKLLDIPPGLDGKDFVMATTPPVVEVCEFAGLASRGKGTLWSSWGDGCIADNGKYYTSIGDHLGKDATSYVYEYDPMTKVLRRVVDVLQAIMHKLGLFGHGKIHSGIHQAADGKLYFSTYWGKQREIDAAFTKGYEGSLLLRYDPKTGSTENIGALVPRKGLPASLLDPARQLLYFHVVYKDGITVYDVKAGKLKFHGGAAETSGDRTFMRDAEGKVYFSSKDHTLSCYDPDRNEIVATKVRLPEAPKSKKDSTLRAFANRPAKDGTLYGMTAAGSLFAFDPKTQAVKDLGPNFHGGDYTAVMVLSPDDKFLYYAPGAHGSGNRSGAPVVQYEIATGKRKVLAFLKGALKSQLNYNIGGTYNVQIDPAGERLYITFNGADPSMRGEFGKPVVVVLEIPPSER